MTIRRCLRHFSSVAEGFLLQQSRRRVVCRSQFLIRIIVSILILQRGTSLRNLLRRGTVRAAAMVKIVTDIPAILAERAYAAVLRGMRCELFRCSPQDEVISVSTVVAIMVPVHPIRGQVVSSKVVIMGCRPRTIVALDPRSNW